MKSPQTARRSSSTSKAWGAWRVAADRRRKARRARIQAALKRFEEGEFGYCLRCGGFIGRGRLRVDPATTLCVECAGEG